MAFSCVLIAAIFSLFSSEDHVCLYNRLLDTICTYRAEKPNTNASRLWPNMQIGLNPHCKCLHRIMHFNGMIALRLLCNLFLFCLLCCELLSCSSSGSRASAWKMDSVSASLCLSKHASPTQSSHHSKSQLLSIQRHSRWMNNAVYVCIGEEDEEDGEIMMVSADLFREISEELLQLSL